jgi:hypothetical protein
MSSLDTLSSAPTRTPPWVLLTPKNANIVGERLQKWAGLDGLAQKTIDPMSTPEEQKKLEKLLAESIAKISQGLKAKFNIAKLNIDIAEFERSIKSAISAVTANPDIPLIAKIKYMEDIVDKAGLLGEVTDTDVSTLRNRRAIESLGVEPLELQMKYGNDESKKQSYFLQKILTQTIGKYAEPAAYWLVQAFSKGNQTEQSKGVFHKETFESTQQKLQALDLKYGMNFGSNDSVQGFLNGENGAREIFLKKIEGGLLAKHPNGVWLGSMLRNWVVSPAIRAGAEVVVAGKTINIVDAFTEYRSVVRSGRQREGEVRETRSVALNQGVGADIQKKIWMDQIKSEFDYLKSANIESKVRSASVGDMVIMGTQLLQMAPIIGDIGGGLDGLVNALSGVNIDGAKINTLERSLNGIFGVLGIAVIGGLVNRAHKAGKLAGMIETLGQMRKYLPEKLEALLATAKNLSPEIVQGIKSLGKFLNIDRHIEKILAKQGLWALHFAPVAKLGHRMEHGKARVQPDVIGKAVDLVVWAEEIGEDVLWLDKTRRANSWKPAPKEASQKTTKLTAEELKHRQEKAKNRSGIDAKIVEQNANILDTPEGIKQRLDLAFSALEQAWVLRDPELVKKGLVLDGKLTDTARDIILAGHNAWDGVYGDLKSVSDKARATRALPQEWRRILMERGIMGSLPADNVGKETEQILSAMNIRWVDSVLQKVPNQTVTQPVMNALVVELESRWAGNLGSLNDLLQEHNLKFSGDRAVMYELALVFSTNHKVTEAMADIRSLSSKKVLEFCFSGQKINNRELLVQFLQSGNPEQKEAFLKNLFEQNNPVVQIMWDTQVLEAVLRLAQSHPTTNGKFLSQMISNTWDLSVPTTSIQTLQLAIKYAADAGHIQGSLVNSMRERLAEAISQRSPLRRVQSIISGARIDESMGASIRTPHDPARNAWNTEFESLRTLDGWLQKRVDMVLRWEFEFFNKNTLDTFLNVSFWDLSWAKQAEIITKIQGERGAFVRQNYPRFMEQIKDQLVATR